MVRRGRIRRSNFQRRARSAVGEMVICSPFSWIMMVLPLGSLVMEVVCWRSSSEEEMRF